MGSGSSKVSASPAPLRGEPGIIEKQKYYEWKYKAIIDERNKLRDTAHRFFKAYKEADEPGWSNRVKSKQIRATLRDEQLRLQSVLRKTYQQAQIMQKNLETQIDNLDLKQKLINNMNNNIRMMKQESNNLNQKINQEKVVISSRYKLLENNRRGVIVGRILTILTLFTILYFTISKMNT